MLSLPAAFVIAGLNAFLTIFKVLALQIFIEATYSLTHILLLYCRNKNFLTVTLLSASVNALDFIHILVHWLQL